MQDKQMDEQESLRLIADMMARARKNKLGKLNFITIYSALAVVLSTVGRLCGEGDWMWAWVAVPVVAYGVPFVRYKMWRWRDVIFSRIVRNGFALFAFMGVVAACYAVGEDASSVNIVMMAAPACAALLLCGLLRSYSLLGLGAWPIIMLVIQMSHRSAYYTGVGPDTTFFHVFYFVCCLIYGLTIDGEN